MRKKDDRNVALRRERLCFIVLAVLGELLVLLVLQVIRLEAGGLFSWKCRHGCMNFAGLARNGDFGVSVMIT
jgi:hypothetical protein